MGQYYKVVNIDKKQYLHPHRFGDGLKLMEFGPSGDGTMAALAVLLSDGNGRGGGDIRSKDPLVGSWAGDRIVIAGNYADRSWRSPEEAQAWSAANPQEAEEDNLFHRLDAFEDISGRMRALFAAAGEDIGRPLGGF